MIPTVQQCKNYLRIDGTEDDALLQTLISVSQEYLSDAGVKDTSTERYGLAVMLLVASYYEERKPYVVGTVATPLEYSLQSLITQLKAAELPVEDTTT